MARPASDIEAGRETLLDVLKEMIRRRGAVEFTLSDLATEAGMSPANIYRFFANKDALYETVAERWFAPKIKIMEEVVDGDGSARDKLIAFFGRRFVLMRDNYLAEPAMFISYLDLGDQHQEIVRGYIDLGDHYLAMIVAQAMDEGHFAGLDIDRTVSLLNIALNLFLNPRMIAMLADRLSEDKLAQIVDALLNGMKGEAAVVAAERPKLAAV